MLKFDEMFQYVGELNNMWLRKCTVFTLRGCTLRLLKQLLLFAMRRCFMKRCVYVTSRVKDCKGSGSSRWKLHRFCTVREIHMTFLTFGKFYIHVILIYECEAQYVKLICIFIIFTSYYYKNVTTDVISSYRIFRHRKKR